MTQITRGQQTTPRNGSARGGIDHLVDLAGLKPRGHVYVRGIGTTRSLSSRAKPQWSRGMMRSGASSWSCSVSTAFLIVQLMRGIGTMDAIGQVLHACGSVRHKGHDDLA